MIGPVYLSTITLLVSRIMIIHFIDLIFFLPDLSTLTNCTTRNDLDDKESVSDLAENYIIFQIGVGLQTYFLPALIPFGLAGNIISFFVMSTVRHTLHTSSIKC